MHAHAPDGIGEVVAGADLVALVVDHLPDLSDGDVVVLTSKVVSKAEGLVRDTDRAAALDAETVRVVARRGETAIVENHLGLVMAAAGIDASNVERGRIVLLPRDPDGTARRIRARLAEREHRNVAVLISDTSGRPWRQGQTDIAIGLAGLEPLTDFAGGTDAYGNPLQVTAPAVADELAGLAELVTGKLGGRPLTVVRGLAASVLPPGEHGPGARALLRPAAQDMFAMGTRESVESALRGEAAWFGTPGSLAEFTAALDRCRLSYLVRGDEVEPDGDGPADRSRLATLATAYGWVGVDGSSRFRSPL